MRAACRFDGVLDDGSIKTFRRGDPITKAEAKAMALSKKPHLAIEEPEDAKKAAPKKT